jgi:hypothetical protein
MQNQRIIQTTSTFFKIKSLVFDVVIKRKRARTERRQALGSSHVL